MRERKSEREKKLKYEDLLDWHVKALWFMDTCLKTKPLS